MNISGKLFASLAILGTTLLTGCNKSDDAYEKFDYLAVQEDEDGNWSFIGPDHKVICDGDFKNEPTSVYNGLFSVKEGDGYSIYTIDGGKAKLIDGCEGLREVGALEDGVIPAVFPNERISLLDKNGRKVATIEPVKGKEIAKITAQASDGLFEVMNEDGKWGYVDTKGKVVIEPKYDGSWAMKDGMAAVYTTDDKGDNEYSVINNKGEQVFKIRKGYSVYSPFCEGRLLVKDNNDRYVFYDTKGEIVTKLPQKVSDVRDFNSKYVIFGTSDDVVGVMDMEGNIVVRAKYKGIQFMGADKFLAAADDYVAILNANGDEEQRMDDYSATMYLGKFGIIALEGKTLSFLDENGKPVKNCDFNNTNFQPFTSYVLDSDYVDTPAIVKAVVDMIGTDGIGKWHIGDTAGNHLSNPGDHLYESSASIEELNKEGYHYQIEAKAQFGSYFADYDYSGANFSRREYWTDATVNSFVIEVTVNPEFGIACGNAVVKGLVNAGFKVVSASEEGKDGLMASLKKGDLLVVVGCDKGTTVGNIGVFKYTAETAEYFKSLVDQVNNGTLSDSNNVAEADSVAVDEAMDWN